MTPPAQDLAARLQAYAEAVEDWAVYPSVELHSAMLAEGRTLPVAFPLRADYAMAIYRRVLAHRRRRGGMAERNADVRETWRAVVRAAKAAEMGRAA